MTDDLYKLFAPRTAPPRPAFVDPKLYRTAHAAVAETAPHELAKTRSEILREWWDGLDSEDKRDMTELFELSDECKRVRGLYDRLKVKGTPCIVIEWAKTFSENVVKNARGCSTAPAAPAS